MNQEDIKHRSQGWLCMPGERCFRFADAMVRIVERAVGSGKEANPISSHRL